MLEKHYLGPQRCPPPLAHYYRHHGIAKLKIREMERRYIFAVLYLWLEKYFSRGDYQKS